MYIILFISYLNKAAKKRKGKTVAKPWKDQGGDFEDEKAALGDCFDFFF